MDNLKNRQGEVHDQAVREFSEMSCDDLRAGVKASIKRIGRHY